MMHSKLLEWYKNYGRHELPWRNTDNIYHIYLSEIMLQQTQVSRVRDEFYPNFLEKFPTLKALADAKEEDVLAAWSGLGYYSRARNLHKTAKLTHKNFPTEYEELLQLPGIGSYTASAVCSFGYHQNVVVIDTNIKRVLKRFYALPNPSDKELADKAQKLLNHKEPRAHNLALMDLGSLICIPKEPSCESCPLRESCQGKSEPELYSKTKKTQYESMDLFYGIWIQEGKIALTQSEGSMYKNMLTLPSIDPIEENYITSFKHAYTKYRLTVKLYHGNELPQQKLFWKSFEELPTLPISSLTKKALKLL
ncbi:A/G-specific adenine glycosylase [Sulfurimonas paralvinellae]|uniref:Adenine DNA glycosylase n=1 Tax=Sulfurimonas paralvinellae TaxID=317658 RepID=A0A7M1BA27_9BACT|nr:A/G-specific adenine glycosylase [Sulfurimonas paralvinellae]QOP46563.1 A/G-specific adenine glycosylase [Sulfurimonas paralvinellae]